MSAAVDLYWLPLGAGGRSVRFNGRVYEAAQARFERRAARDLYHSALEVRIGAERFVIEMAPAWDARGVEHGVVAVGPVGTRRAGRLRLFRYEIRCWPEGEIPDVGEAVGSPRRLTQDPRCARTVLDLVAQVPTQVWGRDELGTGDMWNSNSVTAWILQRSGLNPELIKPPAGGRAPGWKAGILTARRPSPSTGHQPRHSGTDGSGTARSSFPAPGRGRGPTSLRTRARVRPRSA